MIIRDYQNLIPLKGETLYLVLAPYVSGRNGIANPKVLKWIAGDLFSFEADDWASSKAPRRKYFLLGSFGGNERRYLCLRDWNVDKNGYNNHNHAIITNQKDLTDYLWHLTDSFEFDQEIEDAFAGLETSQISVSQKDLENFQKRHNASSIANLTKSKMLT